LFYKRFHNAPFSARADCLQVQRRGTSTNVQYTTCD
jgi:hypothetical protein